MSEKETRLPDACRTVRGGPGAHQPSGPVMLGELHSRDKPLLEIAVIGAPGSGKTTLVHALAARALHRRGRPTPRCRPKARLMPQPARVEMETPLRRYTLLDWPGEAECVRGMMDRLGALSGALIVASAVGGLRPWDVWLAHQVSVPSLIVFLSKTDAASLELERLEADVRILLHAEGYPGDDASIVAGDAWSALCSGGKSDAVCRSIDDLLAALEQDLRPPEPAAGRPFRMAVEEVSHLRKGRFVAATGRIQQGCIVVGDRIAIAGPQDAPPTPRVVGLRRFHQSLEGASAGDRVAVLMRRQAVPLLAPGHILCRPGAVVAPRRFEAVVYQAAAHRPAIGRFDRPSLRDGVVRLGFGGCEANGRCHVVASTAAAPAEGQAVRVSIDVDGVPAAVYEGQRFELRHGALTAFGVVARVL